MTSLHKYKYSIIKDLKNNLKQQESHTDLIIITNHFKPYQWKQLKSQLFKLHHQISILHTNETNSNKGNTRVIKLNHLDMSYVKGAMDILKGFPSIILIGSYFYDKFVDIYDLEQILLLSNSKQNSHFQLVNQMNNPMATVNNFLMNPMIQLNHILFQIQQKQ